MNSKEKKFFSVTATILASLYLLACAVESSPISINSNTLTHATPTQTLTSPEEPVADPALRAESITFNIDGKETTFPVEQQPSRLTDRIENDAFTQYAVTALFNVIGILAHNTDEPGVIIGDVQNGDQIKINTTSRHIYTFQIGEVSAYALTEDNNPYSAYLPIDPVTRQPLGLPPFEEYELFDHIFTNTSLSITLGTCLEYNGDDNYGRRYAEGDLIEVISP